MKISHPTVIVNGVDLSEHIAFTMKAPPLPTPTATRVKQWRSLGGGPTFTATDEEMRAWYAKPWWWRLANLKHAPWNRKHA